MNFQKVSPHYTYTDGEPGHCSQLLYSFLNDKILDLAKLKASADNKINVNQKLKFLSGTVENIAGKGKNAGYQYFLPFPQCFQKLSFSESLKVGIVW